MNEEKENDDRAKEQAAAQLKSKGKANENNT